MRLTNCHVHTFTHAHTPARFLPWPVSALARFGVVRRLLSWIARVFDPDRQGALSRYAQIVETSFHRTQAQVFELVRGFYPQGTRFVCVADGQFESTHRQLAIANLSDLAPPRLLYLTLFRPSAPERIRSAHEVRV